MKRACFTLIPLLAISFLTSCGGGSGGGGGDTPPVTYTITTTTPGITISPTTYTPKDSPSGYEGTITIDDGIEGVLPRDLSSIVLDDDERSSIKDYCEYKKISEQQAQLKILEEDFINNVEFTLELQPLQPPVPWYKDTEYLNSLEKNDIDRVNPDGTVGVVNTLTVNGTEHQVRLIGVDEDKDKQGNTIHTTWEFANLLSDENGHAIATYWNDVAEEEGSNADYMDSTIRAVLNGNNYEGSSTAEIHWFKLYGTTPEELSKSRKFAQEYEGKSVLDMLPEGLKEVLRKPNKTVNIYNSQTTAWEEKKVDDTLFLLSCEEMRAVVVTDYDLVYSYYKYASYDADRIRIKQQISNTGARQASYYPNDGKLPSGDKECYAGYDDNTEPFEEIKGGKYYSRSVYPGYEAYGSVYAIDGKGEKNLESSPAVAMPVAPAFCI